MRDDRFFSTVVLIFMLIVTIRLVHSMFLNGEQDTRIENLEQQVEQLQENQ